MSAFCGGACCGCGCGCGCECWSCPVDGMGGSRLEAGRGEGEARGGEEQDQVATTAMATTSRTAAAQRFVGLDGGIRCEAVRGGRIGQSKVCRCVDVGTSFSGPPCGFSFPHAGVTSPADIFETPLRNEAGKGLAGSPGRPKSVRRQADSRRWRCEPPRLRPRPRPCLHGRAVSRCRQAGRQVRTALQQTLHKRARGRATPRAPGFGPGWVCCIVRNTWRT